jgi:hydantoinase/carbamoylase family amidase
MTASTGTTPVLDAERLWDDIYALSRFGATPEGGITRPIFSAAYEEARAWLTAAMEEAGMAVRSDAAGNLIGRLGSTAGPAVLCGSHADTVPNGGAFDGALGVLAGIACARAISAAGMTPARAFEVVAFADEEGAFFSNLGALAMAGRTSAEQVRAHSRSDGGSLEHAMREAGFELDRIGDAARPAAELAAYLELHVEQGPELESAGLPIGVVDGIVGISQSDVIFLGEADHAGTTPLPKRRDAFLAAAEYALRAGERLQEIGSPAMRLTFPLVDTAPRAVGAVPNRVRLHKELRERTPEQLAAMDAELRRLAEQVAAERELRVEWHDVSLVEPVDMAPALVERLREACHARGLEYMELSSGAGHDAQVMAQVTDAMMIFVPSRGGRSHRPDEHTDRADVARGGEVLLELVVGLIA